MPPTTPTNQIRNLRRAEFYLYQLGIRERNQVRTRLDKLDGVSGLGKVLARAMYDALSGMSKEQWNGVFRWIKDSSE